MTGTPFTQQAACPQLFLPADAPATGPRVAFLLPRGAKPPTGPLGLVELWQLQPAGAVIFLGAPLPGEGQAAFAPSFWRFAEDRSRRGVRLAWFERPDAVGFGARDQFLTAAQTDGTARSDRLRVIAFGEFGLLLGAGCTLAPNPAGDGLLLTPPAPGRIALVLPDGFRAPAAELRVSLGGALAGCAQFDITLDGGDIPRLGAGMRAFVRDRDYPAADTAFFLTALRYPLLSEDAGDWRDHFGPAVPFGASLDPLAPLDGDRSYLAFGPLPASAKYPLPSSLRTNMGYTVHLTPRDGHSRLVFARAPIAEAVGGTGGDALYLTPAGEFAMSVPRYDGSARILVDNLLCGLGGMEYVRLADDGSTRIAFLPGNAAYAPTFDPASPKPPPADAPALAPNATTAWAYVLSGKAVPPVYYAQPDQAPLYRPPPGLADDKGTTQDDLLQFFEVPAATLPAPNGTTPAFPLLPYGGVRPNPPTYPKLDPSDATPRGTPLADYQLLETRLVTPLRRHLIHDHGGPVSDAATSGVLGADSIVGTTPQGLLATFSANYTTIEALTLLRDGPPKSEEGRELQLLNIPDGNPLRTALQSSQLFLVATKTESFSAFLQNGNVRIADWGFDLDPDGWGAHDTILVFKFCGAPPDKTQEEARAWSLERLAENVQAWALPTAFNTSPATARARLSAILQEAIAKAAPDAAPKDREYYGPLAQAAQDPNWSGILALNAPLAANGLPDQLGGLSAGLERAKLFARYVGSATTPILREGGALSVGRSALFGLIDYANDAAPLHADSDYDFQVTKLQALFYNSQLRAFASEVQLSLDRLFGEATRLLGGEGRNLLVLKGSAEDHDGETTYAFSFSGSNRFATPASGALREVELVKAQFATDPTGARPLPSEPRSTSSRFTFWGRLVFRRRHPAFDAFSFGGDELAANADEEDTVGEDAPPADDPPPAASYLSFANLVLTMGFTQVTANAAPESLAFTFEPRGLAIDTRRSPARKEGLFAKFPLKFTGLLVSDGKEKADDYGFMPVKAPGAGKLGEKWYGLTYDLALGSSGALSGNIGLTATLLVAWSPEAGAGPYIGLKLPGSVGGKREITLQGILKLVFRSIEFSAATDDAGVASYLLKLKNIKLKFFVLSLPPSGQSEIIIFGNPSGTAEDKTLGWYAAYGK